MFALLKSSELKSCSRLPKEATTATHGVETKHFFNQVSVRGVSRSVSDSL